LYIVTVQPSALGIFLGGIGIGIGIGHSHQATKQHSAGSVMNRQISRRTSRNFDLTRRYSTFTKSRLDGFCVSLALRILYQNIL
jgi:hypothetical protein